MPVSGLVAVVISVAGVFAFSYAPIVSTQPESGTLFGGATVVADVNASGGQSVKFGSGGSSSLSWQAAWDSRNQATLDTWYADNTGYDAIGANVADFLDISSANIIDTAWLTAREGNGHVSRSNGRWLVENIRSNRIRIGASNVTIRGCYVDAAGSHIYGVQHYPTFANSVSGTVVEYCTLYGNSSEGTGILLNSDATGVTTAIARNNDINGWGTGIEKIENSTIAYNHVHDIYYYTGSHNTSAMLGGPNVHLYRNNFEDGNSSALSIYADDPMNSFVVEQNLFNTPRANYCINFPVSKAYFNEIYDSHLLNNIFGQKYEPQCGSSRPMTAGNWTTKVGNTLMDGTPVGD